jgi:hypothetical protein
MVEGCFVGGRAVSPTDGGPISDEDIADAGPVLRRVCGGEWIVFPNLTVASDLKFKPLDPQ